jgi:hypothetical protein
MPLPSPEKWPHSRGGRFDGIFIALSPEQRDGVVRCVVFEDQRETAATITIRDIFGSSNIRVFGLNGRIVVALHDAKEIRMGCSRDAD